MQISISGKSTDTGQVFRDHAESALSGAVAKYFERAISGAITLEKTSVGFEARIRVNLTSRIEMEASGRNGDAHLALDEAVGHIEKRLRRYKRRLKNHRNEVPLADEVLPATVTVFAPDTEENTDETDVVARPVLAEMDYDVHLMTVEEAVMVFELSGKPALMFRNKAHLGLNMVYRREDGSIGWVDPRGNRAKAP